MPEAKGVLQHMTNIALTLTFLGLLWLTCAPQGPYVSPGLEHAAWRN
jgi:hypothetical protein